MITSHKLSPMSYFGDKLSERLQYKNLTQYRLAKLSGVPDSSITNIISGDKRPTNDIVQKFALVKELDTTLSELYAWRARDDYGADALLRAVYSTDEGLKALYEYKTGYNHAIADAIIALGDGKTAEDFEKWRQLVYAWRQDRSLGHTEKPFCP